MSCRCSSGMKTFKTNQIQWKTVCFDAPRGALVYVLLSFDSAKVGRIRVLSTLSAGEMLTKTHFLDLYQSVLLEKPSKTYKSETFAPRVQLFLYLCRQTDETTQRQSARSEKEAGRGGCESLKYDHVNLKTYDCSSNQEDDKDYILVAHSEAKGNDFKVIFNPSDKLLTAMEKYNKRDIYR